MSITHHGEIPHLDVIVEDEQLSLAIGKRGQNVRLAAELLGSRIDIKSESDVKDEVADALAKMLKTAMAEEEASAPRTVEFDLNKAPGVGARTAAILTEEGYGELETLLAAAPEQLEVIEGVGPKTARAILDWAAGIKEQLAEETDQSGDEPQAAPEATEEEAPAADDGDFMAALSAALQEAEGETDQDDVAGDETAGEEE